MQAGVVEQLSTRVRRLVAPNPGPMTGAGTNTYLVGTDDVAVVDAGPAIPEHVDRILEAGAGTITRVVCTHTHPDHSPAASIIARELGVPMIGAVTEDDQHQDTSFIPEQQLTDGEQIVGGEVNLGEVVLLPGGQLSAQGEVAQADDRIHRRADLMTHIGQEFSFCPAAGFGGLFGRH